MARAGLGPAGSIPHRESGSATAACPSPRSNRESFARRDHDDRRLSRTCRAKPREITNVRSFPDMFFIPPRVALSLPLPSSRNASFPSRSKVAGDRDLQRRQYLATGVQKDHHPRDGSRDRTREGFKLPGVTPQDRNRGRIR